MNYKGTKKSLLLALAISTILTCPLSFTTSTSDARGLPPAVKADKTVDIPKPDYEKINDFLKTKDNGPNRKPISDTVELPDTIVSPLEHVYIYNREVGIEATYTGAVERVAYLPVKWKVTRLDSNSIPQTKLLNAGYLYSFKLPNSPNSSNRNFAIDSTSRQFIPPFGI